MSVGIISSTPIWVPIAVGGAAIGGAAGLGYSGYRLYRLKRKISDTVDGYEAHFSETEAKIVEQVIKRLVNKEKPNDNS